MYGTNMYEKEFLAHVGKAHDENPPGRGSGRFAWGSGKNPYQHQYDFLSEVRKLKRKGLTQSQIAAILGGINEETGKPNWTTAKLTAEISIANKEVYMENRARALYLYDKLNGNASAVAREMGLTESGKPYNESRIRDLLKEDIAARKSRYDNTADLLRQKIEESSPAPVDISTNMEMYIGEGVSQHTKNVAIEMLLKEGYTVTTITIKGTDENKPTSIKVIGRKPGEGETEKDVRREIQEHKTEVVSITEFSPDGGKTFRKLQYPAELDSSRVYIRYAEEGGTLKDGVMEIRRGVDDLSLGNSNYAQVRINVDGKAYLKGMAMYGNDIPDGYDIVFNTNKSSDKGIFEVLKPMKVSISNKELAKKLGVEPEDIPKMIKTNKIPNPDTIDDLKKMGFTEKQAMSYIDKDNPFGALIASEKYNSEGVLLKAGGQSYYTDKDGKQKLSLINKVREEGDWDSWSKTLASQFLSKQPENLIEKQTKLSISGKKTELDQINQITNPVVKQKLLYEFAGLCDSTASDLSTTGFKNQAYQVLLPSSTLKDNEIFAPRFKDGETIALVRYPHGSIAEIPILKNNLKHQDSIKNIGLSTKDAVGINPITAQKLSGADYDGDAAIAIPLKTNKIKLDTAAYPKDLLEFDPHSQYKLPDSAPRPKHRWCQTQMGVVTNLISDMSVAGAPMEDIVKATKHSMVVIDAEKHRLNISQSAKDNEINSLKQKYRGSTTAGAQSIVSTAGAEKDYPQFKETVDKSKMTSSEIKRFNEGEIIFKETGATKTVKKPTKSDPNRVVEVKKTTPATQMSRVRDAYELVYDKNNRKEVLYADYANELKALANSARKEARSITPVKTNKTAAKTYASEVASLNAKVKEAESNAPKERQARAIAQGMAQVKYDANPGLDKEHRQRIMAQSLEDARAMVGASKKKVTITDREWEAIQSNAVSTNLIRRVVNNADSDQLKKLATPKESKITANMVAHINSLSNAGYSQVEIAKMLGISTTSVSNAVNGKL